MTVWIGIDPGEKRLGIARSDALGVLAHPIAIVGSVAELVGYVQKTHVEREVAGVVVGLPLNMDGSVGPIARRSLALVKRLREELQVEVRLWDERLSSRQAAGAGQERGGAGGRGPIDHKAAAVILQSFLDAGCPQRPDPAEMDEV